MIRLVKRYGNRKMYDTQASKYVTLDGVADLVRRGEDLRIIDNDTGEDLTAVVYAQVIVEEQKRQNPLIGLPVLRWIIQQGGATLQEILSGVDRGREALEELAQKGMKQLTQGAEHKGPDAKGAEHKPARGLLNEILELPQKQLEQLQQRIDSQVRASIERVTEHPAVKHELKRIEASVKSLEKQLQRLRGKRKTSNRRRGRAAAVDRGAPD
jgi:polyhydroxyalkanoate synthesis repressor PhaR